MAQTSLRFGSLTLCNPTVYHDGYLTNYIPVMLDFDEIVIPNTAGYLLKIKGQGNSNQTAARLDVDGQIQRNSLSDINTLIMSAQTCMITESSCVGTVYFSSFNDTNTYSITNCFMNFVPNRTWRDVAGKWYLDFTATFVQLQGS